MVKPRQFSSLNGYWPSGIADGRHRVRHNFVSAHYLENMLIGFYQILYIYARVQIVKIQIVIVTYDSSHICDRVMALDSYKNFIQNFVSAQYFEN